MNRKQTGTKVSSKAAKILSDTNSSQIQRKLAASALSQSNTNKQTGKDMEDIASKVLQSPKYNNDTKTLAASVLSQSDKER